MPNKVEKTIAFGLGFIAGYKGVSILTHLIYLSVIGTLVYLLN